MRTAVAVLFSALLFTTVSAQNATLPEVLQPNIGDVNGQPGIEVFKLLPRGTFNDVSGRDEDNPIGIRGGGAYYSFTNRSHSYNKTPQIELQAGNLLVGFAGADYGLIRDLGPGSLGDISVGSGIPAFLVDYQPPIMHDEIRLEQKKSHKYETESGIYSRSVPAVVGHVYALRAISFDEADVLVAFQVLAAEKDGSLTIGWKSIREFDVPRIRYNTDEALSTSGSIARL